MKYKRKKKRSRQNAEKIKKYTCKQNNKNFVNKEKIIRKQEKY